MNNASQLIEFYRQLGLLAHSGLPLPDGIRGMAETCGSRQFAQALACIATDVESGVPLEQALGKHRHLFPELHTSLLRGAEQREVLPEALDEVMLVAERNCQMGMMLRDACVYPATTIWFCLTIVVFMMRYYMPMFGRELAELYEGPLPLISTGLFALADAVVMLWPVVLLCYLGGTLALVFLFIDTNRSRIALARATRVVPGAKRAAQWFDDARISGLLGTLVKRGIPMPDALDMAAVMIDRPGERHPLTELAEDVRSGMPPAESPWLEEALGEVTAFCLAETDEAQLSERLARASASLRAEGENMVRQFSATCQIGAIALMAGVGAVVIIGMFMPMVEMYHHFTGVGM